MAERRVNTAWNVYTLTLYSHSCQESWGKPGGFGTAGIVVRGIHLLRMPSCQGLTTDQNGPIQIQDVNTTLPNNFSWNRLSDFIWVDSPVCVALALYFPSVFSWTLPEARDTRHLILQDMASNPGIIP